ncbi:hypothetical protein B0T14DRAFT_519440 [Immersiella caudata]|uniref:Rhodanese domain-containing protein n=1 Tax=Immersiella caudata TaxID=314043 RepID=A0AA39WQ37_9PEZI|nr:hypothetical protein B0T14DRAFT_519440 [Immersiella caudata]
MIRPNIRFALSFVRRPLCSFTCMFASMPAMQPSESTTTASTTASTPPWHAAYPTPENAQPEGVMREEVLAMLNKAGLMDQHNAKAQDFILVDLRRTDHEGGTIRGSVNLPAQSLYPTIPTLYFILKAAGVRKVIWYCSSSRGRGTRAAGWFADYLSNQGDGDMESLVLVEGIKGWATAGPEYTVWMDGYEKSMWCEN